MQLNAVWNTVEVPVVVSVVMVVADEVAVVVVVCDVVGVVVAVVVNVEVRVLVFDEVGVEVCEVVNVLVALDVLEVVGVVRTHSPKLPRGCANSSVAALSTMAVTLQSVESTRNSPSRQTTSWTRPGEYAAIAPLTLAAVTSQYLLPPCTDSNDSPSSSIHFISGCEPPSPVHVARSRLSQITCLAHCSGDPNERKLCPYRSMQRLVNTNGVVVTVEVAEDVNVEVGDVIVVGDVVTVVIVVNVVVGVVIVVGVVVSVVVTEEVSDDVAEDVGLVVTVTVDVDVPVVVRDVVGVVLSQVPNIPAMYPSIIELIDAAVAPQPVSTMSSPPNAH